ncbi:MAG: dephospho-CoA kinase [Hyphomicrobiales bacterium]
MIILGLTGSIGMGKSTTATMFREMGVPVHDADATVHDLYEGELVAPLEAEFPGVAKNGTVDRAALSKYVVGNEAAMKKLEALVHPAVQQREKDFLSKAQQDGAPIVVLDNPLLFEMGRSDRVDKILVVTAPENIQRERVLARADMTAEKFEHILSRQTPDSEKRERGDFILDTSLGMDAAKETVSKIIAQLSSE